MRKIAILNCKMGKYGFPMPAKEIYMKSKMFQAQRHFVENNYDDYMILSTKYNLIDKNKVIEPYNLTFFPNQNYGNTTSENHLKGEANLQWKQGVLTNPLWDEPDTMIHLYLGWAYYSRLKTGLHMRDNVRRVKIQSGRGVGKATRLWNEVRSMTLNEAVAHGGLVVSMVDKKLNT